MKSTICNHECDRGNCPFMNDPYDANRQVCVKCGHEYYFRRNGFSNFLLVAALVVSILLMINRSETTDSQPDTQPAVHKMKSGVNKYAQAAPPTVTQLPFNSQKPLDY